MYKSGRHKTILVTILAVSLCLPFSISSYATSYSFEEYGDSSNQTWNGTNKVYADGIYVGEMGQIDSFMDNDYNTYRGTNIIDTTASAQAGMDEHSEYIGTLEVNANDILNGKQTVYDATVNATTTVQVSDVLDNDINAGVQFNNSNFNQDVTFSGNAPIYMDGATVNNLSIGDTQQAADVVTNTANTVTQLQNTNTLLGRILTPIAIIYHNITFSYISSSSNTVSFTLGGQSYSYTLHTLPVDSSHNYYVNFSGLLQFYLNIIRFNLSTWYNRSATAEDASTFLTSWNSFPILVYKAHFYTYSYDASSDTISRSDNYRYSAFYTTLYNYIERTLGTYISAHVAYIADTFYRYYNPRIVPESNYFWYAYNSDTGQYDQTNLAGLMQYVTWYLGMIYNDSTNVTQQMHQMTNDINTAATTFQDLNTKEQAAIDQIKTGFNNFLPDNNIFQSFRAITWCSNYLQQIYLALGSYGTVVLIGLLFGVCLQFIGYFRYK